MHSYQWGGGEIRDQTKKMAYMRNYPDARLLHIKIEGLNNYHRQAGKTIFPLVCIEYIFCQLEEFCFFLFSPFVFPSTTEYPKHICFAFKEFPLVVKKNARIDDNSK